MKEFAKLFSEIDSTTRTSEKVDAMSRYFSLADAADAAWAVWFLSGGRPKRLIPVRLLAAWAMEESGINPWLFEETYHAVGDLAETIALLLPENASLSDAPLDECWRAASSDSAPAGRLPAAASGSTPRCRGRRAVYLPP